MKEAKGTKVRIEKELLLLLGFVLGGLTLLPLAVFLVGKAIFGPYPGGFGAFFSDLGLRLRGFEGAAWFLVLSPYLVWQIARLTWRGLRGAREVKNEENDTKDRDDENDVSARIQERLRKL